MSAHDAIRRESARAERRSIEREALENGRVALIIDGPEAAVRAMRPYAARYQRALKSEEDANRDIRP